MLLLRPISILIATLLLSASALLSGCQSVPASGLTPQQVALLKEQGFRPTEDGWGVDLSGKILFGVDEDGLDPKGDQRIREITQALLGVGLYSVRIDGHSDSTGSATYNEALSLRRANAVSDVMVDAGMQRADIHTRGLGDSMPVKGNESAEGRSENRRVAIVVASQ